MNLRLVTAPNEEPVTLNEAKDWLRVSGSEEDFLINSLIVTARQNVEAFLQRAVITQTWELGLDEFPSCKKLTLPFPNLQSVGSVKYYDSENSLQTLDPSSYQVVTSSLPGLVERNWDTSWPTTYPKSDGV